MDIPPAEAETEKVIFYDKEGFSDTILPLIRNTLSSNEYIDYYPAAANTDCTFYDEGIEKLDVFNFNIDESRRTATDPVATEWEGRSDGVRYLANRQGCSCLGGLHLLWVWIYERSTPALTYAQAVEKGIAFFDATTSPGTFCEITDDFWDEITREGGNQQKDNTGNIADIKAKLEQAEFPCVVGRSIRQGQNFVWNDDDNYDGGVVGIVIANSASEGNEDSATKLYGIMFKPGCNFIVVTNFSRGHCRNMVKVDEGRAKEAIDCIRDAYTAGKGEEGWNRITKGDQLGKFVNCWRMAYLLKLHGFILRCRCGDPGRCSKYLDRAGHIKSIHYLVNTGQHMGPRGDPRLDCWNFSDTDAGNFLRPFDLAAVMIAYDIDISPAKKAEDYDEFTAACALLEPSHNQWTRLQKKAEEILRLEDRADRIADVLLSEEVTEE
ncbi:hypothetical protein TrCOL_g6099 [Triparma columacea]|uniref:Uncharacterized protein n=1 Tax=Triparma columacea TaxID=722753 RepID=A0A9W7LGI2_9STRA|nr:hypothetical protein TrCOL_g6099 [Triparma columacea]